MLFLPAAVVEKVNGLLERREHGRLFAVVHFASRQWKVTSEDLIQIENHIEAECGDRIQLEKVGISSRLVSSRERLLFIFSSVSFLTPHPHPDVCTGAAGGRRKLHTHREASSQVTQLIRI